MYASISSTLPKYVRSDIHKYVFSYISAHLSFQTLAPNTLSWGFRYGTEAFSFSSLLSGLTQRFSTEIELEEVGSPHNHTATHTSFSWRGFKESKRQERQKFNIFLFFFSQLKKFKEDNLDVGFGSGTQALEQAIEKTQANIKWVTENKAQVLQWLTEESTRTQWGKFHCGKWGHFEEIFTVYALNNVAISTFESWTMTFIFYSAITQSIVSFLSLYYY